MSLVALLCIFSSISMSFLRYGLHACIQYSKCRSNYCFIQRYNQTFVFICYISANHSKNLVTLRRCNSMLSRSHDSLVLPTRSVDYGFPDHFPVLAHLSLRKPPLPTREATYRKLKTITKEVLLDAISTSALCTASLSTLSLHELTTLYDTELRKIIDTLAPTKTRGNYCKTGS